MNVLKPQEFVELMAAAKGTELELADYSFGRHGLETRGIDGFEVGPTSIGNPHV